MIQYALMDPSHVSAVAALEKLCFSDPWSEKSIASELDNPISLWLVAMDGENLAGYIGSQSVLGEADMMNVAVDPRYRRKGIGQKLITNLIAALQDRGVGSLTLEVRVSNTGAIALYQKLGFAEKGRRRNYYRNPKEDALILGKEW